MKPLQRRHPLGLMLLCLAVLWLFLFCALPVFAAEAQDTLKVAWFSQPGYQELDQAGNPYGYNYEYLKTISRYTGWQYQFVTEREGQPLNWAYALQMLENGQLDLIGCLLYTEERAQSYDFPALSAGQMTSTLFVKNDSPLATGDFASFDGIAVAAMTSTRNDDDLRSFAAENGFTVGSILDCKTSDEVIGAVLSGRSDAGVLGSYRPSDKTRIVAKFAPQNFYFATTKGNQSVLTGLNRALNSIQTANSYFNMELSEKYAQNERQYITLSQEEKDFVAENPQVRVVYPANWQPLFNYDKEKDQYSGVLADIFALISKSTGLTFTYLQAEDTQQALKLLQQGKADLLAAFDYNFTTAEENQLLLTGTYLSLPMNLVQKSTGAEIRSIATNNYDAFRNGAIDLLAGELVYYPTPESCFAALIQGEVEQVLTNAYAANYYCSQNRYQDLVFSNLQGGNCNICIALPQSSQQAQILLSILDKAIDSISNTDINDILAHNSQAGQELLDISSIISRHPLATFTLLLLLFAATVSGIALLSANHRLSEQARSNEFSRFISAVCKANDQVSEIDIAQKLQYRYTLEDGKTVRQVEAYVPERLLEQVHPQDRQQAEEHLQYHHLIALINESREEYFSCRSRTPEGKYRWYSYLLQGMTRDQAHPSSIMLYKRDIDVDKNREEQQKHLLEDSLAVSEQANLAKKQFLSQASHEIRTPLNAIIGYLSLSQKCGQPEKATEYILRAQQATQHLLALVNDILDMSAIESGKLQPEYSSFSLAALVDELKGMIQPQCQAKGLDFRLLCQEITVDRLWGDPLRLKQILINLLSNAIKFTETGGRINLSMQQTALDEQQVFLRFAVQDTGIGIKKDFIDRLFSPFVQQNSSAAQSNGGVGLGLYIAKSLVEMMGGQMYVVSEPGEGSLFTVDLRFALEDRQTEPDNTNQHQDDPQPISQDCFKGKRLLLAEDNFMNMEIATEILQSVGFAIDPAKNGKEAVGLFTHSVPGTYQAILMDVQMPVLDGLAATKEIRASDHPDAASIPIIAMTANAFAEDINKSIASGMNAHISKPFDSQLLLACLAKYINRREESR